jgi:signal transduction histidine kinase
VRLTLRTKMIIMVGMTVGSFLLLIVVGMVLHARVIKQLGEIRDSYLPMVELAPRVEGEFEHLRRGFQDAVAAQDIEALRATNEYREALMKILTSSGGSLEPKEISALKELVDDYYNAAFDLSKRFIAKETGEAIVEAANQMQVKQAAVERRIEQATRVDRNKLAKAFTTTEAALTAGARSRLIIGVICMILVILFSLRIGHGAVRSLRELSTGLNRFGSGDFTQPMLVLSDDELGAVARQANQMSERIKSLLKELEAFSYTVAHDLRAPLRSILGFSNILIEDYGGQLPAEAKNHLDRVTKSAKKMGELIDSLLNLSRLNRREIVKRSVDLTSIAKAVFEDLQKSQPHRIVNMSIENNVTASGDQQLLEIVLTNLIGNAWKFTSKRASPRIEFGTQEENGRTSYFVRDNGAGFDMQYADKLFGTFQRLHTADEFEGTGIGLATVQSIINRHGGKIWTQSKVDHGATFFFTVG